MSRRHPRRRLLVGAVSALVVGLTAPAALALDEGGAPALAGADPTPSPSPSPSPSPGLLASPSPSPSPTPTPTPVPVPPAPSPTSVDPRFLPDLRLAGVEDLRLARDPRNRLQLRFSSTLLNYGSREMKIRAVRKKPRGKFTVSQRVRLMNGQWRWRKLPVGTIYAGDGHSHQHLRDIVRYRMYIVDADGNVVEEDKRRARKIGFCIYDNVRRPARKGQPKRPVFRERGCGNRNSTKLAMGLSVGWGDRYHWTLPGQYVSLAGLPAGVYTLIGEANPQGVLYEQKTTNNGVYLKFRLRRSGKVSIRVLDRGFRPSQKAVAEVSSHDGHPVHPDETAPGTPAIAAGTLASRRRGRLTTRHGLRREHP